MKTRYSSLVSIKKDAMQKSELVVQEQNHLLQKAQKAYEEALKSFGDIEFPSNGKVSDFLAARGLMEAQQAIVEKNSAWVAYAKSQLQQAQETLKKAMIEYEKFNYLELEEMKKIEQQRKIQEAKELDEVALLTHAQKLSEKTFS